MPTPNTLATTDSVAVLLATGFEEVEALAVVDALYRAGIRADLISIENERHVVSSHGIKLVSDLMLADVDLASYTVVFLCCPFDSGRTGSSSGQARHCKSWLHGCPERGRCAGSV